MIAAPPTTKIFMVRNHEGKYFRPRGRDGVHGQSQWVEFSRGKIYTKLGPAKSVVTVFAKIGSGLPKPELISWNIDTDSAQVVDTSKPLPKKAPRTQLNQPDLHQK